MVKICLFLIVKNESNTITRCLNSAKNLIDYVCITDTGSTDKTIEVIKEWEKQNNIPCAVYESPFKDFGYSRTMSYYNACKSFPDADYYLVLDADIIIKSNGFDKNSLTLDFYSVIQKNNRIKYWNFRFFKSTKRWKCVGLVHEFWASLDQVTHDYIDENILEIIDIDDGGNKITKTERETTLLLKGINDPSTPFALKSRYYFYLGTTKYVNKDYFAAIDIYQKRIDCAGWDEEVFVSQYNIGNCYRKLAKKDKEKAEMYTSCAVDHYMRSWGYKRDRVEPLYRIAKIYRRKKLYKHALMILDIAKSQPDVKNVLFVEYKVYKYLIDFEYMLNAFCVDDKRKESKKIYEKLCSMKHELEPKYVTILDVNKETFSKIDEKQ